MCKNYKMGTNLSPIKKFNGFHFSETVIQISPFNRIYKLTFDIYFASGLIQIKKEMCFKVPQIKGEKTA